MDMTGLWLVLALVSLVACLINALQGSHYFLLVLSDDIDGKMISNQALMSVNLERINLE